MSKKVIKSASEWQAQLDPTQYQVTREGATEAPFSGQFCDHFDSGTYHCVCCGHPLFGSDSKFHSGCGWPSFDGELESAGIRQRPDHSHGMHRVELCCPRCDAHLGHMFNDGPTTTGQRYCINSAALEFIHARDNR